MLYPNNIKKDYKKEISHKNRGMDLEKLINDSNKYYLDNDIAVIYKKPTPIGITKVLYHNNKQIIKDGYFESKSTLDYNGLYKGKYIDFDAKVTNNKTSFPLSNVHPHQIEHMKKIINHGGITFLIIKMNYNYYLLDGKKLITFIESNKRKSIPFNFIEKECKRINEGYNPPLDYLKIVKEVYFKESV